MSKYNLSFTDFSDGSYGEDVVEIDEATLDEFKETIIDILQDKTNEIRELYEKVYKLEQKVIKLS